MAHPFKEQAHETSKSKAHALLGQKGGGNVYMGSAMSAKAGPDGSKHDWHGHSKSWHPAGAKAKGRADRFARGGKAKDKEGKGRPKGLSTLGNLLGYGEQPSPVSMEPGQLGEKHGGRAQRADGGRSNPFSSASQGMNNSGRLGPAGGNIGQGRRSIRRGKVKGDVNITVNPSPRQQNMPMLPPIPPGPPPGGLPGGPPGGGPPGMPPGMPPPGLPPGGAMPPPGGLPPGMPPGGPPGMPPGGPGGLPPNPMAAQQALAAIAGGAGPMGAGMPGRGPFAKGGRTKLQGGGAAKRSFFTSPQAREMSRGVSLDPMTPERAASQGMGAAVRRAPPPDQEEIPDKRGGRLHKAGGGPTEPPKPPGIMANDQDADDVGRARGGRASGLAANMNHWRNYAKGRPVDKIEKPMTLMPQRARGGRLTAGAETGVGREQKAARAPRARD